MLKRASILAFGLAALAALASAQGPAEPTGSGPAKTAEKKKDSKAPAAAAAPEEVADSALDRERSTMDSRFAARVGAIKADADRRQAYHVAAERKRLDFERHSSEERKAFYLYLKSVAAEDRESRLKEFDERQAKDRLKFDKEQLSEAKNWFDEDIEKAWKSASLMEQPAPASAMRVETPTAQAEAPAARPRRPAIVKKPRPVAKKRRSRVVHEDARTQGATSQGGAPVQGGGAAVN